MGASQSRGFGTLKNEKRKSDRYPKNLHMVTRVSIKSPQQGFSKITTLLKRYETELKNLQKRTSQMTRINDKKKQKLTRQQIKLEEQIKALNNAPVIRHRVMNRLRTHITNLKNRQNIR
tara:strand:+ start:961 stop:1317 length:357 start_codon:yes stop_codon:yes gene_type:complete